MAANKIVRFGPVALTTTLTTNIINPAAAGAGAIGYTATASYIILRRMHIANKTAAAATFSLWIGATGGNAAGTEWFNVFSVAANSVYDWGGQLRLDAADFLVGGSATTLALVFEAEGEVGLV